MAVVGTIAKGVAIGTATNVLTSKILGGGKNQQKEQVAIEEVPHLVYLLDLTHKLVL